MARRRKNMNMPTVEIRVRAWARAVKAELFPDKDAESSLSHRINDELVARVNKLKKQLKKEEFDKLIEVVGPKTGAEFASSGRWASWWGGKEQPTLEKINAIEKIIPGSRRWFNQGASSWKEHPAHTLFYALDLWATTDTRIEQAMHLLIKIAAHWSPRSIREGSHQERRLGWYLEPFSNNRLILPPDLAYNHYRSLEPASIVESMLWTGNYFKIHTTEFFHRWLMDLVAAALAVDAILIELDEEQEAISMGGDSGLIASRVLWIFVSKPLHFSRRNDENEARQSLESCIWFAKEKLPIDQDFHELLWVAIDHFEREINLLGCKSGSLQEFNSKLEWIRKRADNTTIIQR